LIKLPFAQRVLFKQVVGFYYYNGRCGFKANPTFYSNNCIAYMDIPPNSKAGS